MTDSKFNFTKFDFIVMSGMLSLYQRLPGMTKEEMKACSKLQKKIFYGEVPGILLSDMLDILQQKGNLTKEESQYCIELQTKCLVVASIKK